MNIFTFLDTVLPQNCHIMESSWKLKYESIIHNLFFFNVKYSSKTVYNI